MNVFPDFHICEIIVTSLKWITLKPDNVEILDLHIAHNSNYIPDNNINQNLYMILKIHIKNMMLKVSN